MERTLNRLESSGFSSELTFASRNRPEYSVASFSRIGPSARHGPHQGAQKSTTTGTALEASRTSCSKVAAVTSRTLGDCMRLSAHGHRVRSICGRNPEFQPGLITDHVSPAPYHAVRTGNV